jgi:hypothetical protein
MLHDPLQGLDISKIFQMSLTLNFKISSQCCSKYYSTHKHVKT